MRLLQHEHTPEDSSIKLTKVTSNGIRSRSVLPIPFRTYYLVYFGASGSCQAGVLFREAVTYETDPWTLRLVMPVAAVMRRSTLHDTIPGRCTFQQQAMRHSIQRICMVAQSLCYEREGFADHTPEHPPDCGVWSSTAEPRSMRRRVLELPDQLSW